MTRVVHGLYAEIKVYLDKYKKEYLQNLCGAEQSIKWETTQKQQRAKMASLEKSLKFIVDRTNETSIVKVIQHVKLLGSEDGLFGMSPSSSAPKGK